MSGDTIVALSSGAVPAAVAIVRLSGPRAFDVATAIAGPLPVERQASLRLLRAGDGTTLDRALVLRFDAPRSATGEDVVEFHCHGGRAVVAAVLAAVTSHAGVRLAEAGEFTRRALMNGRIDLTQAEGIGALLSAETEGQRKAAMRNAEGVLRRQIDGWGDALLRASASIEAAIEFAEEDDVAASDRDDPLLARASAICHAIAEEMRDALRTPPVDRLRDGIRVVLAGPPNAGKSTLFNRLVGRDAAIVSSIAGTTRDRIEAPVMLGGLAFVLVDTAGLAEASLDPIERIGIDRTHAALGGADIVLWLGEGAGADLTNNALVVPVHAKADLDVEADPVRVSVSALTGEGVVGLIDRVVELAGTLVPAEDALALSLRHRSLVAQAVTELEAIEQTPDSVLAAEHCRRARNALDRITGHAGVEPVLDTLFSAFCIGK